ncbi:OsmC family protein [Jeotgalicoccus sp. FSL K6-3177]|jgi:Predicted redox protein, regulator of disulfide bond formation|uniref:OsmC family protein n=1 Tax=Jeotgalicoccus sp. FSL K6-3177 TaxID=2921494 RepID=UPI0030FD9F1A
MAHLKTVWNGSTKGTGTITADKMDTQIAIPTVSGGSGEGANPTELLAASAASCYAMTLIALTAARNLPVKNLTMATDAVNSKDQGLKIVHYPEVTMPENATEEEIKFVERAFNTADMGCHVGNLLKRADAEIKIEGKIIFE